MSGIIAVINETHWALDPMRKNKDLAKNYGLEYPKGLTEIAGLIPLFFTDCTGEMSLDEILEQAVGNYGFPCSPIEGGTVSSEGEYKYPQDEPLYPVMRCRVGITVINVYAYGLVALFNLLNGKTVVVRMD